MWVTSTPWSTNLEPTSSVLEVVEGKRKEPVSATIPV